MKKKLTFEVVKIQNGVEVMSTIFVSPDEETIRRSFGYKCLVEDEDPDTVSFIIRRKV